jgi:head-tail adaptor
MSAGRYDEQIILQRATTSQDAAGEETLVWSSLATEWAWVSYGKGNERRQAAMEQAQQAATFRVNDNTATRSVGLKDRLVVKGTDQVWDIVGNVPVPSDRGKRDIDAILTADTDGAES